MKQKGVVSVKYIVFVLVLCLLLAGCGSWMDGEYSSVTPHKVNEQAQEQAMPSVKNRVQLKTVLGGLVEQGAETGRFSVEEFDSAALDSSMDTIIADILLEHPIGAYAVEDISYELGTASGVAAVAVTITYSRSAEEIRAIRSADNMEQARALIEEALVQCDSGVVLRIGNFLDTDFTQLVEDFAEQNPSIVMELPQVTASVYPEQGSERVVDIRFVYQTNRDSLRRMQKYVQPVFTSAALYVSSEEETSGVKYARLYAFLMERNAYKAETSITPAYSLLRHGVGDSKAFALVYAAMCREAELECLVVSGTHQGEARFWNIICEDGVYYHVDLLSPNGFVKYSDAQLSGYVWDYSAYPACGGK